jgi:putative nucleotidyltransferase with HDIG domain
MPLKQASGFVAKHFELILVISLLLGLSFIMAFVPQKMGFLNFYYLPVLAAGFAMGKRGSVLTAFSAILIVVFSIVAFPQQYLATAGPQLQTMIFNLLPWGGFLLLSSYTVGYLYEEKQKQIEAVRTAYIGVLEILSKLIESVDRYTEGHSVRVSRLSMDIAIALGLEREEVENVRVAGLLHDIGKFDITTGLIGKAADLTDSERDEMSRHPELGARLVSKVGPVLKQALPIILSHHDFYIKSPGALPDNDIPMGARIVAVADTYDAIITDRPYRRGRTAQEAIEEIRKGSGTQFDPVVVEAFERVSEKYVMMET